jgi:hypothetical protein
MTAIEAAELAGIDLSLIDENLRLTPEQRGLRHEEGLRLLLHLEETGYDDNGSWFNNEVNAERKSTHHGPPCVSMHDRKGQWLLANPIQQRLCIV